MLQVQATPKNTILVCVALIFVFSLGFFAMAAYFQMLNENTNLEFQRTKDVNEPKLSSNELKKKILFYGSSPTIKSISRFNNENLSPFYL